MKKITLFIAAAIFSFVLQAQTTLIHNTDNVITGANSVACGGGDNLLARQFVLADFGITESFEITEGEIGVQSVDFDFDVTVNIYELDAIATFPDGFPTLATLLGSEAVTIPLGSDLTIVSYTLATPIVVPASAEKILVEVFQELDGVQFWLGGTVEEDDSSWLASINCALPDYDTTDNIGFPDAHFYITVTGDEILGVNDNLSEFVSIYPNPASDILNIKLPSNIEIISSNLYDILGKDTGVRLVNGTMDTSNLARGVYIINIVTSAGTLTEKVIKE